MIKQIQLRGISRTPSDRMSEDGGLSESLNMYLDTAENAPVLVPKDVTCKLGLPADLQAERVFIHKTANYENYIAVQRDKVVAYTPGIEDEEPLLIFELEEGEKVNDITAVGNTLIVTTTRDINYILYDGSKYKYLGNAVHFPQIKCWTVTENSEIERNYTLDDWFESLPSESLWNQIWDGSFPYMTDEFASQYDGFHTQLWELIEKDITKGELVGQAVLRYAIELYDGTLLSSLPLVIGAEEGDPLKVFIEVREENQSSLVNSARISYKDKKAYMQYESDVQDLLMWKDIIKNIKIYASLPTARSCSKEVSKMVNREEGKYRANAELLIGSKNEVEDREIFALETTALTHLVANVSVSEIIYRKEDSELFSLQDLIDGCDLTRVFKLSDEDIAKGEILNEDDMQHYNRSSLKLCTYNNAIILSGGSQVLSYGYNDLCSLVRNKYPLQELKEYTVSYFIKTPSGEKKVNTGPFAYTEDEPYAFQFFPDVRAYKMVMQIKNGSGEKYYGEFEMKPHPWLSCAYASVGLGTRFGDKITQIGQIEVPEDRIEGWGNKLLLSKVDNPFIFPIERTYTFQSKILGVAVATTALSQGQFGQFPLYVFTEDGIWAMETASDGSFVSQKPLSREVCVNPDSICSIDNAVVFVTAKGVMMIQGSQVMNISPYMNGRHYIPNESATNIIARQEGFSKFEKVIKDETPFVAFMKKAKIAYDYAGQRLICIVGGEDKEDFQYVYKIDTQTWHKVAFNGLDLIAPLNSYPDCLVRGEGEVLIERLYIEIPQSNPYQGSIEVVVTYFKQIASIDITEKQAEMFLKGEYGFDVRKIDQVKLQDLIDALTANALSVVLVSEHDTNTKIYSLGTILDVDPEAKDAPKAAKGILITRPFDLGEPDVYKSIKSIKIRGDFDKENVKYILQGSDNGRDFYTLTSLRGKSWKMFRIFILADLEPTERISWIDVDYEPRYQNKLR